MDKKVIDLIDQWGSRSKLAAALGIYRQAVHDWNAVPIKHLDAVERITGIPREELRPDIFKAPRHARKAR
jgi:DNA-binding transcriptional regulator YdaS (Cro superfamily)